MHITLWRQGTTYRFTKAEEWTLTKAAEITGVIAGAVRDDYVVEAAIAADQAIAALLAAMRSAAVAAK